MTRESCVVILIIVIIPNYQTPYLHHTDTIVDSTVTCIHYFLGSNPISQVPTSILSHTPMLIKFPLKSHVFKKISKFHLILITCKVEYVSFPYGVLNS